MTVQAPATGQDATLWQGQAVTLRFTVTDLAGAAVDVSGKVPEWRLAPRDDPAASVTIVGTINDGPGGVIDVDLADTDTAEVAPATYRHQLWLTDEDIVIAVGHITLAEAVV